MRIIIVDDDALVTASLKIILEANPDIEVLAAGTSGVDAIKLYDAHKPDILLMDIRMEQMDGLEASGKIIAAHPEAKILLLTTFADDEYIVKAIHTGAKGYILKQDFESVAPAITAVYNGQTVFGNEIMNKIPSLLQQEDSFDYLSYNLTEKEFELIRLIADGLNNKEIAEQLYLSEGTVRNYLSSILMKLDLRDRTQLACFYYKNLS